tara:strand:- start:497 stop:877 length:381 start_codon:yes stop_codon:yes gene_type:complete
MVPRLPLMMLAKIGATANLRVRALSIQFHQIIVLIGKQILVQQVIALINTYRISMVKHVLNCQIATATVKKVLEVRVLPTMIVHQVHVVVTIVVVPKDNPLVAPLAILMEIVPLVVLTFIFRREYV